MKKLLNYIFWPALAGVVFAGALLLVPSLLKHVPAFTPYFPQPAAQQSASAPPVMVSYSAAIKKAAPAVVSINSINKVRREVPVWLQRYFGAPGEQEQNSLGSGVIISPDGYIVTSYHVFFGNDRYSTTQDSMITVTMSDGRDLDGKIVALDEANDLALLKIDEGKLPYLTEAKGGTPEVGDIVLAIGNPRNIGQSVSFGIISALWRREDSYIIQTDAAINPGNSGGALIDISGNLLGINSTIVSESGGSEGISFAISADNARKLLDGYLSTTPSSYLGVDTVTLSRENAIEDLGIDIQGFLVRQVIRGGPADKAGIQSGDVITGVGGKKISFAEVNRDEANRAIAMISSFPAGELVTIEVYRDGEYLQIPTILGVGRPNYSGVEPIEDPRSQQDTDLD